MLDYRDAIAACTMLDRQLWQHWTPLRRHMALRYMIIPALLWLIIGGAFVWQQQNQSRRLFGKGSQTHRMRPSMLPTLAPRVSCYGPRDRLLTDSPDDELQYINLEGISYPNLFLGSHRELRIEQTWMTADGRYGPYGFGEGQDTYNRTKVDWAKVDWGRLQDDCFQRNAIRFPKLAPSLRSNARFTWKNLTTMNPSPRWDAFNNTRRTALVVRAYSNFEFKPEALWSIRSLIVETALQTGGEYAVVLLVHIQDREKNIFRSKENYNAAFNAANIPPELQSIAILWDDHLLESWYEAVEEHRTMWQVNQPLQLFALHYPEFDHYWQIELDQRFSGNAGKYLDSVTTFARNEPRKQALERATYAFDEHIYGTYQDFMDRVDIVNKGKSRAWGPIEIPDIDPIGPEPPVPKPEDEEFIWGVGEEADVVVTSFCADVLQTDWVFRDYIRGFINGLKTPRWFCPPAVMRGSRSLLLSVHQAQHDKGLSLPSEAVLPTWALWHGLKLSYPPQPAYMRPHEQQFEDFKDDWTRDQTKFLNTTITPWFGNTTETSPDGLSHSNPQSFADRGMTWWWTADYPRKLMDVWLAGTANDSIPQVLTVQDGKVYMPNLAMHPVKT